MRASSDDSLQDVIRENLRHARTRLRRAAWERGCWAAAWSALPVLALLLFARGQWGLSVGLAALIFVVVSLAIAAAPWLLSLREHRDLLAVAAYLESRVPALRNDVQAALTLSAQAPASEEAQSLRARLLVRVLEATARLTRPTDVEAWLPSIDRRRWMQVGGAAVVLSLLFMAFVPAARRGWKVSERETRAAQVREEMIIGALSARVFPPAHTGLPAEVIPSLTSSLSVVEGASVMLSGITFVSVDEAWVQIGEGESARIIPLTLDEVGAFTLPLTAAEDMTIRFGFRKNREEIRDRTVFTLTVLRDAPPTIEILSPLEAVDVHDLSVVEIAYEVSDDFGIAKTELVWHFVGNEQDETRLPLLGPSGKWADDRAPFDPAPLYMQPGDQVMVYIEATDSRTLNGAQVTRSSPVLVFIDEAARPEDELLSRKEAIFEKLLAVLGDQLATGLSRVEPDGKGGFRDVVVEAETEEENAVRVGRMHKSLQNWPPIFEEMQQYIDLAQTVETWDPHDLERMRRVRETLFQHEREARRVMERAALNLERGAVPTSTASALARMNATHIRETEKAALALRQLISAQKSDDVARSLAELSDVKDRIRDLLEQYRETRDENLRARIGRELDRLSQRMNELLDKLAAQMENLPSEHYNAEGMEPSEAAENVQEMGDSMQSIRERLNAGDVDGALQALEALEASLNAMNQEFGDPFQNADDDTLSALDQAMGEVMDEVNALEQAQHALEQETAELQKTMMEERRQALQNDLRQKIDRALQDVRSATEATHSARASAENGAVLESLEQATQTLDTLRRRLESEDVANAEDAALDAMQALEQASEAAARARAFAPEEAAQQALRAVERRASEDARRMRRISEEMSELQRSMQGNPNAQQQAQMQQMAQRQSQLQQRSQNLSQRIGEMAQEFPMMGEDATQSIDQAQEAMGEAAGQLSRRQGAQAQGAQGRAVESLRTMRQEMQQRMARQRASQQQRQRGRGGRPQSDRVEIPQEQVRDLRQRDQIMDAMREGSLEQWQDPIRQYYESLVR